MRQLIKSIIFLLMVLLCGQGIANETVQEKIIWKIFPIDEKAVLISEDYQVWLLHGLTPNTLTWDEWLWREEIPQPDASYSFDIKNWEEGETISIFYSPWQYCEWEDAYRNDTSLLQYCDYVIENAANTSRVYAKPLQKEELYSLYVYLIFHATDLSSAGFSFAASELLHNVGLFVDFECKVKTECENKINGYPFDEQYTSFNEQYYLIFEKIGD